MIESEVANEILVNDGQAQFVSNVPSEMVTNLKAGRELDQMIHDRLDFDGRHEVDYSGHRYSTEIDAAMTIVDKLREQYDITLKTEDDGKFSCTMISKHHRFQTEARAMASTLAEAIAQCALETVE